MNDLDRLYVSISAGVDVIKINSPILVGVLRVEMGCLQAKKMGQMGHELQGNYGPGQPKNQLHPLG